MIPAHYAPAQLLGLAAQRGVDVDLLLRGSKIFYDDLISGKLFINHEQLLKLTQNALKHIPGTDASFLFGQRFLSVNNNPLYSLLLNSQSLEQAFEFIETYSLLAAPWIKQQILEHEDQVYIILNDAIGLGPCTQFFVEAHMTSLMSLSKFLRDASLPANYYFDFAKPKYVHEYEENFGFHCYFNAHVNAIALPKSVFNESIASASATNQAISMSLCRQAMDLDQVQQGFLTAVYQYLVQNIQHPISLEQAAENFHMSPATFKRKLKRHNSSFQKLHDLVRKQVSLYLLQLHGYNNEQVARHLAFADVNNFRRSFKRWTGMIPSQLRTPPF